MRVASTGIAEAGAHTSQGGSRRGGWCRYDRIGIGRLVVKAVGGRVAIGIRGGHRDCGLRYVIGGGKAPGPCPVMVIRQRSNGRGTRYCDAVAGERATRRKGRALDTNGV